jgi:hypothetical protein
VCTVSIVHAIRLTEEFGEHLSDEQTHGGDGGGCCGVVVSSVVVVRSMCE